MPGDTRTILIEDAAQLPGIYQSLQDSLAAVDFSGCFNEIIIPAIRGAEHGYFDSQTGPSGEPWPELSPFTVRQKGHDLILFETGRLEDSVTGQTSDTVLEVGAREMTFGTSREFAGVHQDGSDDGRIPQREFLGFDEETINTAVNAIADSVISQISGF